MRAREPVLFAARLNELAYLVNVLLAVSNGALRPAEATGIAVDVCALGLMRWLDQLGTGACDNAREVALASDRALVKAFRVGWHVVGDERWDAQGLKAVAVRARANTAQ